MYNYVYKPAVSQPFLLRRLSSLFLFLSRLFALCSTGKTTTPLLQRLRPAVELSFITQSSSYYSVVCGPLRVVLHCLTVSDTQTSRQRAKRPYLMLIYTFPSGSAQPSVEERGRKVEFVATQQWRQCVLWKPRNHPSARPTQLCPFDLSWLDAPSHRRPFLLHRAVSCFQLHTNIIVYVSWIRSILRFFRKRANCVMLRYR